MDLFSWFVAIMPVILIGLYIYKKDHEKESSKLLLKLFLLGVFSCFPAIVLGTFVNKLIPYTRNMSFFQTIFHVFVSVALVEEICKWFFVYKFSYKHREFNYMYDMIVYSSFVALGFACFENVLYVSSMGIFTGLIRAISAVPGHVCDGIFMGYYLALSKYNLLYGNIKASNKYKILSLVVPFITHGIYDFCLSLNNIFVLLVFVLFLITMYVVCIRKIKELSMNDVKLDYYNKKTRN